MDGFILLLRSHVVPCLPRAVRTFAYRIWRKGLAKTLNCYMLGGACYLVYLVKRIWTREYMIVYPQPLGFTYLTWKLAMLSGYKVVRCTDIPSSMRRRPAVASLYHQDSDYQVFDPRAINGRCTDITKVRVDDVFSSVFGYSIMIDPARHVGPAVRKSDANSRHDGTIIECPIAKEKIEEGFVYQKLIDNTLKDGLVREFRVCVIGHNICEVEDKHRDEASRFKMRDGVYSSYIKIREAFSKDEEHNITLFCDRFGLDVGELDVLRDNLDGRIYIVDANKTTTALGARRPWRRLWSWYRRAAVFRGYVRSRMQFGYGTGQRSPAFDGIPAGPGHAASSGTRMAQAGERPET